MLCSTDVTQASEHEALQLLIAYFQCDPAGIRPMFESGVCMLDPKSAALNCVVARCLLGVQLGCFIESW